MRTPSVKALPFDVRVMNVLATALFILLLLALFAAALAWVSRLPIFAIKGVSVTGDVSHYNAITLRANVIPRLQGTFFTMDLNQVKQVFESMPWVRRTVVSRDFPSGLQVKLQEHQAVAYWGNDGDTKLVNNYGEVFEANLGELELENLPRLNGPSGQAAQVLTMLHALSLQFEPLDLRIEALSLSPLGGWRAQLDSGTALELGSGEPPELLAKVQRFLGTVSQVTGRYQRTPEQLASVDLRHTDGYAIRLNGVATLRPDKLKQR